MATSSRPFQSQTVARLVAGYRQVVHGAGRWLRQGRTAAVWGLQVVAYPLYAAVQGLRLGYRRLQAARPWQALGARLIGSCLPERVEADFPIRSLLSVIQPPVVPLPLARPGGLRLVNTYGQWLRQSKAGAVLTPGQWQLIPFQAPIRGIASDLETRQLVLVTVHNDIFTDLTDDQQQRLQRAIVLMLAEYARLGRRLESDRRLQQPGLPLPKTNSALLPPLRWVPPLVRWMQTSALAAATNLFGEADQVQVSPAIAGRQSGAVAKGTYGDRVIAPTTSPAQVVELVTAPSGAIAVVARTDSDVVLLTPGTELEVAVGGSPDVAAPRPVPSRSQQAEPIATDSAVALPPDVEPLSLPPGDAIEAQVVQVSYIDHPLVLVLRGLDWVLYAIEIRLRQIWAWVQKHW